ncbi:MAG: hypothetical protein EXX96DRAFT_557394 [Benjaminiella poitrasii]|nr:MAG: hypothetical protein EXX96DRAFT_557394 [Benjaminiella poitrasii]
MKEVHGKRYSRLVPFPYRKSQLESNQLEKSTKPQLFNYNQACAILQALELNRRKRLSKKCIAHLAVYVFQAWEDKTCPKEKIQQLYYMMNNLLDTTGMDHTEPLEVSLQKFCQNSLSTPAICSSVTLLIAISYVERLNKRYRDLKGTPGCGSRMIMVAYIMASKYIHNCLKSVIYTNARKPAEAQDAPNKNKMTTPLTPPTSPEMTKIDQDTPSASTITMTAATEDRNLRIARMEREFLFFLDYDLSVQDPSYLVQWARTFDGKEMLKEAEVDSYTSADEGDDEMDDE